MTEGKEQNKAGQRESMLGTDNMVKASGPRSLLGN